MADAPPPVPPSLAGMSDEERQKALDIGASTQLEAVTTDSSSKSPNMTPTIGDDRPEFGKTFVAAPEPTPEPVPPTPAPGT